MPHVHLSSATHPNPGHLDQAICDALCAHGVDLLVLVGYMKKLGPVTLAAYGRRAINIHPALLPAFGGKGMYGIRVHEAVLAAGACETGVTVHLIDDEYDHGAILAQCRVPVMADDTAESLSRRVLEREHSFLVETLVGIVSRAVSLPQA